MQLVDFFPVGQQYKHSHPRKCQSFVHVEGWLAEHPEESSNVSHWHCPSHPKDTTMAIKQIQAPSLSFICLVYKLAPRQKLLQWEWEGLVVLWQLKYLWELSQWGVKRRVMGCGDRVPERLEMARAWPDKLNPTWYNCSLAWEYGQAACCSFFRESMFSSFNIFFFLSTEKREREVFVVGLWIPVSQGDECKGRTGTWS